MKIAVVGLSHKTASVEIRERLSIPEAEVHQTIQTLKFYPHINEIAILSTCNRMEVYAVLTDTQQGVQEIIQYLSEEKNIPLNSLRRHLFVLLHEDAVTHLMRVTCGLDSLVLGEGQILAQVKTAHQLAHKSQGTGRVLNHLFKTSLTAGKRVRTETDISTGAMNISSAAVELACLKTEAFHAQDCVVVGAGKMSELLIKHLLAKGASRIRVVNRSTAKAEEMLSQFQHVIPVLPMEELLHTTAKADLVFTSTSAPEPILQRSTLEPHLNGKALTIFDISVPRNVAPDVQELHQVKAYYVDDLKQVVEGNRALRRRIAAQVEKMVEVEVLEFQAWSRALEAVPTINSLRDKVETIREQELEKALSRLGSEFAEKHQSVLDGLTRAIVNKILHDPMVQLRAEQDVEVRRRALQSLQVLFNLEEPAS
ncbi:MAG: glutamyl-tRNA reductase [Gloeobacterales cyanobacterium]